MAEGAFEGVVFNLVKAVHVELSYEAVHLVVAEVVGQYDLFKLDHVLDDELETV